MAKTLYREYLRFCKVQEKEYGLVVRKLRLNVQLVFRSRMNHVDSEKYILQGHEDLNTLRYLFQDKLAMECITRTNKVIPKKIKDH